MRSKWKNAFAVLGFILCAGIATAGQQQEPIPASDVTTKSIKAIGYIVGGGATKVIFVGTSAAPQASGEARVEVKKGPTTVEVKLTNMPQASTLGTEFLTYVLWVISPDGRTVNLGEIPINKDG